MVKVVVLIKRKPGISKEDFAKHYEEVHAPLTLKHSPGVKRYLRNHVVSLLHPPGAEELDCITEMWFEDMKAFEEFGQFWMSNASQPVRDDEASFQDAPKTISFLVEEKVSGA